MRPLIFGFSRPIKWKPYAQAIMAVDHDDFDHGYIRFISDRWKCDFIYQSSGFRTNFMGGNYFNQINKTVEEYAIDVADDIEAQIGGLCVSREGRPYPVLMILGLGIVRIIKILSFGYFVFKNPFPSDLTDCIAEQAAILNQGLSVQAPFDFNNTTPKTFRDWLMNLPGIRRIK